MPPHVTSSYLPVSSATTFDPLVPAPKHASGALQIAAATIGNALEWFDLLVYGYFATTIGGVFFPNANPAVSLLLTFTSFGLSYLARPVGAIVLGAYADRAGRKAALALSIQLMVIGTGVMAIMPSYASIGLLAPIAVFLARLTQGFAVAGEFGSSTAFMIEHGAHRKGFFSSWQMTGQQVAKLLAALFGFVLTSTLTAPQLHTWGWRVPFAFGLLVGPVGMYIRRKVDETPEFIQTAPTRTPIREVFATEKEGLLLGAGLVALGTAGTYFSLYLPTYATTQLHMSPALGYFATMVLATLGIVLCPVAGHLADRVGLTRMMLPAAILMLLTFYPVFRLIVTHPGLAVLLVGLIWETLLQIAYVSALPAVMAGIFPARTRVTGLSLSYNLGVTVFGGFAPAIFTWLTAITHDKAAPAFYLTATGVISIVAIVMVNRRHPHMLVRAPRVG
jgi:MHS family proline/betaine transporter-like MFS transporter